MDFILKNFSAPIAFYLVFNAWGTKPAIATALAVCLLDVPFHRWRRIPFSPFFIVAVSFTLFFGVIDLLVASPRFFRLEPFFQNFTMGTIFTGSLIRRKPILNWFAAHLPPRFRPASEPAMGGYLRRLTWVWAVYFYVKSFIFLWLAYQVDLGQLVVWRTIIGGGSLALLAGGEILYRKWFRAKTSELQKRP